MHTTSPRNNTGFTVIELLVVIAIIAVLSAIVVSQVTQYIAKSNNAAVKEDMDTVLKESAVYYDAHGSYTGFFSDSGFTNAYNKIYAITGTFIEANNGQNACICTWLLKATDTPANSTYCVDTSGYKKITTNGCGSRCANFGGPAAALCTN